MRQRREPLVQLRLDPAGAISWIVLRTAELLEPARMLPDTSRMRMVVVRSWVRGPHGVRSEALLEGCERARALLENVGREVGIPRAGEQTAARVPTSARWTPIRALAATHGSTSPGSAPTSSAMSVGERAGVALEDLLLALEQRRALGDHPRDAEAAAAARRGVLLGEEPARAAARSARSRRAPTRPAARVADRVEQLLLEGLQAARRPGPPCSGSS